MITSNKNSERLLNDEESNCCLFMNHCTKNEVFH